VGEGAVQAIIDGRKAGTFTSLDDFCQRVDLRLVGKRALECLVKVGALDKYGSRPQLLEGLDTMVNASTAFYRAQELGQLTLFGGAGGFGGVSLPKTKTTISRREMLAWEKELIGLYVSDHPLQPVMADLQTIVTHYSQQLTEEDNGKTVTMAGVVTNLRPYQTKKGDAMGFVSVEDLQGHLELVVFPKVWKEVSKWLALEQIVVIKGKVDAKEPGSAKILVDSLSRELKVTRSVEAPRPAAARAPSAPAWTADASAEDEPPWSDDEPPPPWDMEMDDPPAPPTASTSAGQSGSRQQAAPSKPNGNGHGNGRGNGHGDSRGNGSAPASARATLPAEPPAAPKPVEPAATVTAPPVVAPAASAAAVRPVVPALGVGETPASNGNGGQPGLARPAASNGKSSPLEAARPAPAPNGNGNAPAPSPVTHTTREQPPAYAGPRQKVTLTFYGTGDKDRDARVMRRAHGLLTSYSGEDEFEFVIYEEGVHGCQVRFPNDSTGYCEALAQQLSTLLGPGCVEVSAL
jgi:DNA polymerase-3 subunit alpha